MDRKQSKLSLLKWLYSFSAMNLNLLVVVARGSRPDAHFLTRYQSHLLLRLPKQAHQQYLHNHLTQATSQRTTRLTYRKKYWKRFIQVWR
ncbi:hypothetical protein F5Y19DRAFT_457692 [Xylariaceae sp. FL1651]|nr:hypothetical protein F5Y19DRAFT_457692 [Xylariaceae sp. FL1651]